MASALDWVCLDLQHGEHDDVSMQTVCAQLAGDARPVHVRVRANDAALIGRALDCGADGVVVPMVEDRAGAAAALAACRYPPAGHRSWGPLGAAYGRPVAPAASAAPACLVMVETGAGLDRVEEIAATPGIDGVFVGPVDLSLSLGTTVDALLRDPDPDSPLRRVVRACAAAGVTAAAFAGTPERAGVLRDLGYTRVAVTTDVGMLTGALADVRRAVG